MFPFFFGCCFLFPYFEWGCCGVAFSSLLLGGVALSHPSLGVVRFVRLPCGWWSFVFFERQFNGASELNQVVVKQSEPNE